MCVFQFINRKYELSFPCQLFYLQNINQILQLKKKIKLKFKNTILLITSILNSGLFGDTSMFYINIFQ